MKQKLIIIITLLLALACAAVPAAADSESAPLLPMQFWGTASYSNGDALPAGTVIIASLGGEEFTHTMAENGKFGARGSWGEKFLVDGDAAGETIVFTLKEKVDGETVRAVETVTYAPGENKEITLTFQTIGVGIPYLTPTNIRVSPESIDIQADGSVSCMVTVVVNNTGTADSIGNAEISGTILNVPFTASDINAEITRKNSAEYTFSVVIGPNVHDALVKRGDYTYALSIQGTPTTGQKTTYLHSSLWKSSISTATKVNPYFAVNITYPVYTDVPAHAASAGVLTLSSLASNESSATPITAFEIPVKFNRSVAVFEGYTAPTGVTVTDNGFGTLKITGEGLYAEEIAVTLKFRSTVTNGWTSDLSHGDNPASVACQVKSDDYTADIITTAGSFTQMYLVPEITPAVWAPSTVMENTEFSVNAVLSNPNKIPVDNVTASLVIGGDGYWSETDLSFRANEIQSFQIPLNLPAGDYTIVLTAAPEDGISTTAECSLHVEAYELSITEKNKADWEIWNDYNPTVFSENYPYAFGTYYTTNVAGKVNVTIDFGGKEQELFGSSFASDRLRFTTYAYVSDTNTISWTPMETVKPIYGIYPYTITLEANGRTAAVSGVLTVKEPVVDIKVLETVTLRDSETTASYDFDVYNRNGAAAQSVEIALSAGSSGRTLQGLDYLEWYPHGCPEQVTSPMIALLMFKEYYQNDGVELSDNLKQWIRNAGEELINDYFAYPDGANAQQLWHSESDARYGGWAWGTSYWNGPSTYYTTIPMYGIALLKADVEENPEFWTGVNLNWDGIDLNASANWILEKQKSEGDWSNYNWRWNSYLQLYEYYQCDTSYWYLYDYFSVQALAAGYPYLNSETQEAVLDAFAKTKKCLDDETYMYYAPEMAISYLYLNQTGITVEKERVTALLEYILSSSYIYGSERKGMVLYAAALCDEQYGTSYLSDDRVDAVFNSLVSYYDTSGRWDNTYNTGVAIRGLNAANDLESGALTDSTAVQVSLSSGGTEVFSEEVYFDQSNPSVRLYLTAEQIQQLYGTTEANLKGTLTVTKPTGFTLVSAVTSKEKIPKSAAYKTTASYTAIPNKHIDPISNNFSLTISPVEDIVAGGEYYVPFTVVNQPVAGTDGEAADLGVMILEIVSSDEHQVIFNSSKYPDAVPAAYYQYDGTEAYINHMYDAENGKLYVYIGSDTGSDSVIKAGEAETYYVPLEFTAAGTATVEARVYPMYEDEMMALADKNFSVFGYGNLNLKAVNEREEPLSVNFTVEGDESPVIGVSSYSTSKLEGTYNVTVQYGNTIARLTVPVVAGELSEKSVRFVENIPVSITGEGEAYLLAPVEEETISLSSLNRWNAETSARYSLNLSVAGDSANASITVDMPVIYWQGAEKVINSSGLGSAVFDTIQCQVLSNGMWTSCAYVMSDDGKTLTIPAINPAEVTEISIVLTGRTLGDVTGDGKPNTLDAARVLQASVNLYEFSETDIFYGDVSKDGEANTLDAARILQYSVSLVDENYVTK